MKRYLLPYLFFICIMPVKAQDAETFRQWGNECFQVINREFKSTLYSQLYKEVSVRVKPDGDLAFVWPLGVQLKALVWSGKIQEAETAYHQADIYYCNGYNKATRQYYWAYNATAKASGDRYYDDNAWIARTLLDLYKATNKIEYLDRAKTIIEFCMSGKNASGGIRWHEKYSDPQHSDYNSTSICATAPTACACLVMYQVTGERKYLTGGRSLYQALKTKGWGIGYGYRGYENAVIMQAALLLYDTTLGDSQFGSESVQYLSEARQLAHSMKACYMSWQTHRLNETGEWGGHDMTDAYVHLFETDGDPYWLSLVGGYLSYLHANCRNDEGHYPQNWNADKAKATNELIHQASAASAFYKMASTPGAEPRVPEPVAIFNLEGWNIGKSGKEGGTWGIGLHPGKYNSTDLRLRGHTNNRFTFNPDLTSVMISPGYQVVIYDGDNFTGNKLVLEEDISNLGTLNWDNKMRSMEVINRASSINHPKEKSNILVYPTQFNERLYLHTAKGFDALQITNMMGQTVYSTKKQYTSTFIVDTATFPLGMYVLSVRSVGGSEQWKLKK